MLFKKISQLTSISSPSSTALLAVQDGDTTYNFGLNNFTKTSPTAGASVHNNDMNVNAPTQLFYITSNAKSTANRAGHKTTLTVLEDGLDVYDSDDKNTPWFLRWDTTNGNLKHRNGNIDSTLRTVIDNKTFKDYIRVIDATTGAITLAGGAATSTSISFSVPTGYTPYMLGPCKTIGYIGIAYAESTVRIWTRNTTSGQVSGAVSCSLLCVKTS